MAIWEGDALDVRRQSSNGHSEVAVIGSQILKNVWNV